MKFLSRPDADDVMAGTGGEGRHDAFHVVVRLEIEVFVYFSIHLCSADCHAGILIIIQILKHIIVLL